MIVDMPGVDAPASSEADAAVALRDRIRTPVVLLSLAGAVLVASSLFPMRPSLAGSPLLVLDAMALALWVAWVLCPPGGARELLLVVDALTAAVAAGLGAPAMLAPLIAALIVGISQTPAGPRAVVPVVGAAAVALTIAAVLHGQTLGDLLSLLAGLAIGTLGGITRRQRRIADLQQRELLTTSLAAAREAAQVQLLEARSAAARDVHDVLAHSLGGLVLQLDAIEALLEHGRVDEAAARAAAARGLAGDGLAEARRAVAALRDPAAAPPPAAADDALEALLAAHRSLGGTVTVSGDLSLAPLDGPHRDALAGALREALVNARRHAPGAAVRVVVDRAPHATVLRVENPLPAAGTVPSVGGGHGLTGMAERFRALDDGSTANAGPVGGTFVVAATAVLP